MSDPTTPMKVLAVPLNASDSGTWDQPVNNNSTAIDGMFAGTVTVSLTNANVVLTAPTGSVTAGAGPTQSQNAILRFTGTLTGSCVITVPLPGFYIADNRCTVGTFTVRLSNGGGGEVVAIPPGTPVHIYSDGTNVRFVNMPPVGTYMDMAVTDYPNWVASCTVVPWLKCDGTVYSVATYPFLGALLGSTFGGNGSTTFGVPDLRGRSRLMIDASGRITTAGSGVDGTTIASAGGSQNQTLTAAQMPLQTTGTESATHTHQQDDRLGFVTAGGATAVQVWQGTSMQNTGTESATHTHQVGNASPTAVTTLPPALIAGQTFIKT